MNVSDTVKDLQRRIKDLDLHPIGFVPTMGALHKGHLSLVNNARKRCPLVVVSIFVNPNQFNDINDLRNYPRTIDEDLSKLGKHMRKNDIVFIPGVKEIYPEEDNRKFNFGNLDEVMEALHRPGHFNGVAQVVSRLFDIVKPDFAYFGLKDFQQLAIIRELVKQTGSDVIITGNPIIRERDGLAMSSRNMLLNSTSRKNAPVIYRTLSSASKMIKTHDIPEISKFVQDSINKTDGFKLEYFEIADDTMLLPVRSKSEMQKDKLYYGFIAVHAGKIRLIDNIKFELA